MGDRKYCVIVTKGNGEKEIAVRATRLGIRRYIAVASIGHSDNKFVLFHVFDNLGSVVELVAESITEPTYYLRTSEDVSFHSEEKVEIPFGSKLHKQFMEQFKEC